MITQTKGNELGQIILAQFLFLLILAISDYSCPKTKQKKLFIRSFTSFLQYTPYPFRSRDKYRKNNKFNKNQDLQNKEAKKGPEMYSNIANIAKVTRIFLAS